MERLNENNLMKVKSAFSDILIGHYDRRDIQPGIVHFGVGNFHRGHQAKYIDNLLSKKITEWGIIGVSMRSSAIRDKLAPQDFIFSEVTLSNTIQIRIIRSILNILVATESPMEIVSQLSDPRIKLVTITITEKGYYLSSNKLDNTQPEIVSDTKSLKKPYTIYGFLASTIIQRRKYGAGPLSVLCCDNIQNGGELLRTGVEELLTVHDRESLLWIEKNVSFASSVVDRVTPSTDLSLIKLVTSKLLLDDRWPVAAEPFSQWIIENKFAAEPPPLERVGVKFCEDISPFEQMKLRFLNASHSIVAVLGYLGAQENIHEAVDQPVVLEFLDNTLFKDILPANRLPNEVCGKTYIREVLERFKNRALPYKAQQVNTDSSQKISQRWFPTIDSALKKNRTPRYLSFAIAAWVVYIEKALDQQELNDPLHNEISKALLTPIDKDNQYKIRHLLAIVGAEYFDFFKSHSFIASVVDNYQQVSRLHINEALTGFLVQHSKKYKD